MPVAELGAAQPSVSVVICAYTLDRWADLGDAVRSALDQASTADREVILCVDHNAALAAAAAGEWPAVRVIESTGAPGLSGARNGGVAAARHEVVAFLDDDARAAAGWLDALVAPYRRASVLGTGGHAEPAWDGGRPRWFPEEFDWVVGCSYRGLPTDVREIRNPLGCNMSFRRAAIVAAGGFREDVGRVGRHPTGGEETELSIRIRRAHPEARILHVPKARVHHRVPRSRTTWRYFISRCYQEGRSKALISRLAGADAALATERRYVARTLPAGVLRHAAAALRGDPWGPIRAGAIVGGAVVTAAGYALGRTGVHRLRMYATDGRPGGRPDGPTDGRTVGPTDGPAGGSTPARGR